MIKTNWQYDDIVTEVDLNQIGMEINANTAKVANNLDPDNQTPLTLTQGLQVVEGGQVPTQLNVLSMKGRTLVNLLGRDGNCENISKFNAYQASLSLDATNKVYGDNGIKVSITTGEGCIVTLPYKFIQNKYYIGLLELKNGNAFSTSGVIAGQYAQTVQDTTKFHTVYKKITSPTDSYGTGLDIVGTVGQYAYVDGIRLYEISLAEYNAIDTMTLDQISEKYPYVDDMKHVNGVYVMNKGKNLFPSFNKTPNVTSFDNPYKWTVSVTANNEIDSLTIPIFGGNVYTLSIGTALPVGVSINVYPFDIYGVALVGTSLNNGVTSNTFIAPTGAVRADFQFYSTIAGIITFDRIMLNLGGLEPFEPQRPSYMYLPDVQLKSNVDGSVSDILTTSGEGKPVVTRRLREVVLDGSFAWEFSAINSGSKRLIVNGGLVPTTLTYPRMIKYDGKPLINSVISNSADTFEFDLTNSAYLNISISNVDSGWGESYTPTAAEIKAYFYGWRMYNADGGYGGEDDLYNGTGSKGWCYRDPITGTKVNGLTTILPTTQAPITDLWQPYRLMYQLAASVTESVEYEGSLLIHDGANQIEVGTGVVVREAANPVYTGAIYDTYVLNHIDTLYSASRFKYRTEKILNMYRYGIIDDSWNRILTLGYGKERLNIYGVNYDIKADYSVTYEVLDKHTLGIAPQAIQTSYAPNVREAVEDLAQGLMDAKRDISVLQNVKAQKQQPQWIAPTLLNGWVNYGDGIRPNLEYYKDDFGIVRIKGTINTGTLGSTAFYLPVGYRPKNNLVFVVRCFNTAVVMGTLAIASNGAVVPIDGANAELGIGSISFLSEQ